ncbi:hypothetical protein D3H34_18320 [Acidovorax cavernicola]|uniref:Uncharacterized protein n=2 Tax=Acidovorax cavernicola TaxID=1675792 RepID=A0A9X8D3E5_9BURK|nr:hypothetical protein D3H34_18320 [Acidovorax cavernicola]
MPLAAAASPTLDAIGQAPRSVHRLKFHVDPVLAADIGAAEAGRRLVQYVADVNSVFTRETVRSFVFDPATDLQLVAPSKAPACSLNDLVDGEIVVCLSASQRGYSHGGLAMSWTYPVKGVIWNLNWRAIHDPQRLSREVTAAAPESTEKDYLGRQLKTLLHELEHVHGAGSGEYYHASHVTDTTGVAPKADLALSNPRDRYWWPRQHWRQDPLLGSVFEERLDPQANRSATLAMTRFTEGTKAMINTDWRQWPRWAGSTYMAATAQTRVAVTDRATGQALPGAAVSVWRDPGAQKPLELLASGTADAQGRFVFDWGCGFSCFAVGKTNLLVKAGATGRENGATWFTIFDAFEQKAVQGRAHFTIDLALGGGETAPPTVSLAETGPAVVGQPLVLVPVASDASGAAGVKVMVAGNDLPVCTFVAAPYACHWTPARPGVQTIQVLAINAAGRSAIVTANVFVQPAGERVAAR